MHPRHIYRAFIVCAMLFVAACGSFGGVKPETFNQSALLATHAATGALETIGVLHTAGKLTDDEVRAKVAEVDKFKETIDAARVLYASNPGKAEDDLTRALAGLNALNTLLKAKQAGSSP